MADSSRSGGVGVIGLLGVVFVTLKLTGVIPWSWWWVTAPFWGGLASVLALTVLLLAVYGTGKLTMGVMSLIDGNQEVTMTHVADYSHGVEPGESEP